MEDIKVYQDLTFEVLDKLIMAECSKGNSKLDLSEYKIGVKMQEYLKQKGFDVFVGQHSSYKSISW